MVCLYLLCGVARRRELPCLTAYVDSGSESNQRRWSSVCLSCVSALVKHEPSQCQRDSGEHGSALFLFSAVWKPYLHPSPAATSGCRLCIWGLGPRDGAPDGFQEKGDGRQPPFFFWELPLCSPSSGESLGWETCLWTSKGGLPITPQVCFCPLAVTFQPPLSSQSSTQGHSWLSESPERRNVPQPPWPVSSARQNQMGVWREGQADCFWNHLV